MNGWQHIATLDWEEPLALAKRFAGHDIALLYSSLREQSSGTTSYLFVDPIEEILGNRWEDLPTLPATHDDLPLWVGYLGYGMGDAVPASEPSPITMPNFRLIRYAQMFRFDHGQQTIAHYSESPLLSDQSALPTPNCHPERMRRISRNHYEILHCVQDDKTSREQVDHQGELLYTALSQPALSLPQSVTEAAHVNAATSIARLTSNMTRKEYLRSIAATIEQIQAGNFYQANITRKFFGAFSETPDSLQLFANLCNASPAPYSAYIRQGGRAILSSSPESFLRIDPNGTITTRPIKGSARRDSDAMQDAQIQETLRNSSKNHAENLMIVDLMRNDLARVSVLQSVNVTEQAALYSYRTIHHLISTICAQKLPHITAYDAVRACFPPGSMTGAPKIAAMRWCAAQETLERGIYSGAIGWFGGGDTCDLSVIIRTLILDNAHFEFQVGGGIVADSTPEEEWRETISKARGILTAMGLDEADLEGI